MDKVEHKCPICGAIMTELDPAGIEKSKIRQQIDFLGHVGVGTSGTSTTIPSIYINATSTSTVISKEISKEMQEKLTVKGVPYECPNPTCGHKMSFRS